jgi:hypothetical protein
MVYVQTRFVDITKAIFVPSHYREEKRRIQNNTSLWTHMDWLCVEILIFYVAIC